MAKKHEGRPLELQEAIMLEVRRHPEWPDILGVTITERHPVAPPHPNWIAVFTIVWSAHCPGARVQIDYASAKRVRLGVISGATAACMSPVTG